MKQGCKDLDAINYRHEGLAADFYNTQKTEIENAANVRIRSEKDHGGAGLKRSNLLGGFLQILQDTRKQ
jgi:hypothetical protein